MSDPDAGCAPPAIPAEPVPVLVYATPPELGGPEVYRERRILILRKGADLPLFCVKCNRPTTLHRQHRFGWHHPALSLILLGCIVAWPVAVLVYIILALVLRQQAAVSVPLCTDHDDRRRRWKVASVAMISLGLAGLGLGLYGGFVAYREAAYLTPAIAGFVMLLAGALIHTYSRPLRAHRITSTHAQLIGACNDYLAQLPGPA